MIPKVTIEDIRDAIIRQEGNGLNPTNPGNLRGAPWITSSLQGVVVADRFLYPPSITDGFWNPPTVQIGIAGLDHLIALHRAQGNSLTQFIAGAPNVYAGFAPGADGNKDPVYVADVMKFARIPDEYAPLWEYV
jgi:hypothetical protein